MAAPGSSMAATAVNKLFSVAGKNVLVTGGSRGIGYMIAKGFSDAGANVLISSRDENACKEAAASCNINSNNHVEYVTSNVSTREGCDELALEVGKFFNGRLDVLVNNAGTSWGEPLDRHQSKTNWGFDKVLDLNVKGIFYLTRACLPLLTRRAESMDDPARIINVGSVAGIVPQDAPTHGKQSERACTKYRGNK